MKQQVLILLAILAAGLLASEPVVTNVMAGQQGNQVLIAFTLSNPYELDSDVSVEVSDDRGATYTIFPTALSGDIGLLPAPASGADYEIIWNYAEDGVGPGTNYRVKVIAEDGAGEVAQPFFDPPGGTYDVLLNVSIDCATDGATIRYTDDGSEPTEASAAYTAPIEVSSTTILKAKAFKYGWTPSATSTAIYDYDLVFVPGGTFIMGDTIDDGLGADMELPAHSVTLSPFYIGRYEVTQEEYAALTGSNPAYGHGVGDNYPVYYVSWYSAITYCNLKSLAQGFTPCYTIGGSTDPADWGTVPTYNDNAWNAVICDWSVNGYRLPTEAEWEYAARGASNTPDYLYSGSDDINAVAWCIPNAGSITHPVGSKAPNGIGTYDMSGNVYELCWDWWDVSYYHSSPENNPTGPNGGFSFRVSRGGSWDTTAFFNRVANRIGPDYPPYAGNSSIWDIYWGIRLCRSAM